MDILHLVDRLEETLKKSPRFPFSAVRLVDERRVWSLVDQMRISVPEEVRRAKRISQERESVLAQAREEAARLVRKAEQQAGELVSDHAIAQAAEAHSATIRAHAEQEAAALRSEADDYVFNALCRLEEELRRTLRVVENGLHKIQVERGGEVEAEEEPPQGP